MTDLTAILAVFVARMAGGYAICLGLFGPSVTEGSWRKVSLFTIAGLSVVAFAAGVPWPACAATAGIALAVQRGIAFGWRLAGSTLWMLPCGAALVWAAEGATLGWESYPSAIAIGGTLGAMLLGHSYLTARGLSFDPLKRMALLLFWILVLRAATVAPVFFTDHLQMMDFVFLSMRGAFGLLLPLVLGWMVVQCVKIESNQSATGILYAMTVLVGVFGELVAVYLKLSQGLPA